LLHSNIYSNYGGQPSKEHVITFCAVVQLPFCCVISVFVGWKALYILNTGILLVLGTKYAFYIENGFLCFWGFYWFQFISVSTILSMHCVFRIQQIQDEVWWEEWQRVPAHQSDRSRWWGRIHLYCQKSVWWSHLFCFHSARRYVI